MSQKRAFFPMRFPFAAALAVALVSAAALADSAPVRPRFAAVSSSASARAKLAGRAAALLGRTLKRIDVRTLIGKYIGETEKNLRSAFEAAAPAGALLFFDEADALFGKRTSVRDAHDRYANQEVSYVRSGGAVILGVRRAPPATGARYVSLKPRMTDAQLRARLGVRVAK